MAYKVSNKNNVHFVTREVDGYVLARFDGKDGNDPKEQAVAKAKELANAEQEWRRGIS